MLSADAIRGLVLDAIRRMVLDGRMCFIFAGIRLQGYWYSDRMSRLG
jgi:hypothetical protein